LVTPEYLVSTTLAQAGFSHAFFTRRGGASLPPFDSLHFAPEAQSDPHVAENYRSAAGVLGVSAERLYVLSQVHGHAVRVLGPRDDRAQVAREQGDALIATALGQACGVRVADCVPILVADRASGAVAAIHSGWKGTVQNVAGAAVAALRSIVGGPGDLAAAVGPHIEACCFEIGREVADALAASPGGQGSITLHGQRPHADLRSIVRHQLEALGVEVDDVRGCTVCEKDRFFSYRRDGERSGRMLAAMAARPGR
jgi:YfiH family protein